MKWRIHKDRHKDIDVSGDKWRVYMRGKDRVMRILDSECDRGMMK